MPGPAELAIILLLIGIVAFTTLGIVLWGRARVRGPARSRPTYLGPDATLVEERLRRLLDAERVAAGRGELRRDPHLEELARHHAHWMSTVARTAAVDDQGRDVDGRCRDLAPDLDGPLLERLAKLDPAGPEERAAAVGLRNALGDGTAWTEGDHRAAGVGVASGSGRLWACVVVLAT